MTSRPTRSPTRRRRHRGHAASASAAKITYVQGTVTHTVIAAPGGARSKQWSGGMDQGDQATSASMGVFVSAIIAVAGRQHERRAVGVQADRELEGRPDGRRRLTRWPRVGNRSQRYRHGRVLYLDFACTLLLSLQKPRPLRICLRYDRPSFWTRRRVSRVRLWSCYAWLIPGAVAFLLWDMLV